MLAFILSFGTLQYSRKNLKNIFTKYGSELVNDTG